MRKTTLFLLAIIMATSFATAATGWFEDFLTLKVNGVEAPNNYYIGTDPTTGALPIQGAAFGIVTSLELSDINLKYWADNGDTRDGGALYFKIMSADGSTVIVPPNEIIWTHTYISGNNYQGTKPGGVSGSMSFLRGLPTGSYQLHIWAKSWGPGGDSWLSNSNNNYVATFSVYKPIIVSGASGIDNNTAFATLKEAVDSLNAHPDQTAGDIEIKIAGDVTEPANFGLAVNTGSKKITIRPDADANRTITFTQAAANASPYGHFVIGYGTSGLSTATYSDALAIGTNNVIIDGFAQGGSTKRLKFTTTSDVLNGSSLITILGGCSGTTIKNCILDNQSNGTTGTVPKCIYILQYKGTITDAAPLNTLIENNQIISIPSLATVNSVGIQMSRNTIAATKILNTTIRNNYFLTRGTSVEIYYADGATISGNEFKVRKGTATGISYAVYLRGSAGNMNVIGNRFTELSTSQTSTTGGTWGVFDASLVSGPFNMYVYNNTFSGMDRTALGATNINQCYIASGVNTIASKISHNTFYLPALTQPTQAGYYNAIKYTTATRKADIQNNIFISNEDAKSCFISDLNTAGTVDNNIYFLRAGNANARIVSNYATMLDYRTPNATADPNSKYGNVNFTDAANGDLTIAGLSVQDNLLRVPSLETVTTDILGTVRNTSFTYAGAHESTLPFLTTGFDKAIIQAGIQISKAGIYIPVNATSRIELYTLNGALIDKAITSNSYSRALSNGAYIVKINGKATKFVK